MKPLLTACAAGAAMLATNLADAKGPPPAHNFIGAPMSGANEVPPVETCAEGATQVKLKHGVLTFKVNVENIDDVVAAHLHFGAPGENGPVLVTLYEAPPPETARYDDDDDDDHDEDTLAFGAITDDDVKDVEGVTFADGSDFDGSADGLLRLLREGAIYVNVHTALNPAGEIRAQLRGNGTGGPNPNRGNGDGCTDDDHDDKCCGCCCDDDDADGDHDCCCDGDHDGDDSDRLRADLNDDGVVNEADLRILLDSFTGNDDDDASSDDDEQEEAPRRRGRRGMIPVGR